MTDDNPHRQLYEATVVKLSLLRKSIGLDSAIIPSYDEHSDDALFSHYNILFEAFHEKTRHSFEVGKTAGNILLNMLPDYLVFSIRGEDKATDLLAMADSSCDKLSTLWKSLFGKARSITIEEIRAKISVTESMSENISVESLIKECETLAKNISAEFEKRV